MRSTCSKELRIIGFILIAAGLTAIIAGIVYGATSVCNCPDLSLGPHACDPCMASIANTRNKIILSGTPVTIAGAVIVIVDSLRKQAAAGATPS